LPNRNSAEQQQSAGQEKRQRPDQVNIEPGVTEDFAPDALIHADRNCAPPTISMIAANHNSVNGSGVAVGAGTPNGFEVPGSMNISAITTRAMLKT